MNSILMKFVIAFAPIFSKPVFEKVKVLIVGAILSPASRTVTNALRVMGLSGAKNFLKYHRVLARDRWSSLLAGKILLNSLLKVSGSTDEIVIGFDEHLERRRGRRITAKGIYRDAVRSSDSFFVKASGLRWLSFMLLAEVPFAKRVWALPFLTILCPSERYHTERRIRHRKLTERARQAILWIWKWLPERELIFVGDASFAAIDLLNAVREKVVMVTRLRLDAALYEAAQKLEKREIGRPRKKGRRLPNLTEVIKDERTVWETVTVNWYGTQREIWLLSGSCVWFHFGKQAVPIRWVIVRDPLGIFETQAVLCTKQRAEPKQIVEWYLRRWQVEVTFEESRRHLGIETNRQWSAKAIKRTTPCLFGLFSLVAMMAEELSRGGKLKIRSAVWYEKEVATFSDAIGCVRQQIWEAQSFQTSKNQWEMIKIPRSFLQTLTDTLCFAA